MNNRHPKEHDKALGRLAEDAGIVAEPRHTPGPWEAWNAHGGTILRNWRIGESNTTPGVVRPIAVVANEDCGRSGDEQAANARLLAAAPDLLVACEAAKSALEWAAKELSKSMPVKFDEVEQLRAAIDKASQS